MGRRGPRLALPYRCKARPCILRSMAGRRGVVQRMWPALGLLAALVVVLTAAAGAVSSLGRPIPSLFIDPYGDFSVVYLPTWGTDRLGLRLADRWADAPRSPGLHPAAALDETVATAAANGNNEILLQFSRGEAPFSVVAPIRRIKASDLWWFHGVYTVAALLILWFGGTAYLLSDRRPGAIANLCLSASAFVFLTTFFDYHTTRWLAPLFAASTLSNPLCLCAVALFFPTPLALPRRGWHTVKAAAMAGGAAVLALALDTRLFLDLRPLRLFVNVAATGGLLFLAVVTIARLRAASGAERRQIVSAAWGMGLSPALLGVGFAASSWWGLGLFHLLLPFGVALFPLAVAYALMQHNILETKDVLTRRLFAPPSVLLGLAAGGSVYFALRHTDGGLPRKVSVLYAGVAAAAAMLVVWHLVERFAFASARRYRPSIERLRDRLAQETEAVALERALVEIAETWLDVDGAAVLRRGSEVSGAAPPWDALQLDARAFRDEDGEHVLYQPLRIRGRMLGALRIPHKKTGAPFTTADLAVLDTLASLGALGLQHIAAMRELEELRQIEAQVPRQAVDLLAAEMAHEIQHPLAYFRHLMEQLAKDRPLERTDVEIGCDEVARLERMLEDLKKLQLPSHDLAPLLLRPLAKRVAALLRRLAEARDVRVVVDVPAELQVIAHPDPLLQLLQNLVKNAVLAAQRGGSVEVRARAAEDVVIEVRDDGPGIPEHLGDKVFQPWVTTRADGTGLGLAVAQRTVRSFGWTLSYERAEDRWTIFRIRSPRPVTAAEE
jgi:signal transduction histidine kinase